MHDNSETIKRLAEYLRDKFPDGGLICVTGLGGSGKTTILNELVGYLGRNNAASYDFDRLYFPHDFRRSMRDDNGESITGCHPLSFDKDIALEVIKGLKKKNDVPLYATGVVEGNPVYSKSGTFTYKRYVFVDGLAAMHNGLDSFYDMMIFMDCDIEIERERRISRDTTVRKRTMEDAIKVFDERRRQYEWFVLPYKEKADILITSNADYSIEISFRDN